MTQHKSCTECGRTKPLTEFYRNSAVKDGFHTKCKRCVQARQAGYRRDNVERIKARRQAAKDSEAKTTRQWYDRHPGYAAAYYREHRAEHVSRGLRWARENAHRHRMAQSRRRSRLNGPFDAALATDYSAVIKSDPCVYCGDPSQEIDHIVPISRDGTGAWDNLAPICGPCNRSKATRSVLHMLLRRLSIAA